MSKKLFNKVELRRLNFMRWSVPQNGSQIVNALAGLNNDYPVSIELKSLKL